MKSELNNRALRHIELDQVGSGPPTKLLRHYVSTENEVRMEGFIKARRFLPHGELAITNSNGRRILLGQYVNGKANGNWTRWYDNGKVFSEYIYSLGLPVGKSRQYWANGQLARESIYGDGMHTYEVRIYNKRGELEKDFSFKKGRLVKAALLLTRGWLRFDADSLHLDIPWSITPEKLCYVDQEDRMYCKTPYQIWHDLCSFVDPEVVEQLLSRFNDVYGDLGLDQGKKTLTACAGTFVATDIDTSGSAPVSEGDDHNAPLTEQEANDIYSACLTAARAAVVDAGIDGSGPGGGPGGQSTRDAVATIDDTVANCRDSGNSMVAQSFDFGELAGQAFAAAKEFVQYVFDDGFGDETEERSGVFKSTSPDGNSTKTRNENTGETTIDRPGEAGEGNLGGRTVTTSYGSVGSRTDYYDKDGRLIRTTFRDEADNTELELTEDTSPTAQEHFDAMARMGFRPGASRGGTRAPSAGQPEDEGGLSRCEQLAESWARKKAECEASNWQTYSCQEMLRIFTGCADPALVDPSPDGNGVVCPHDGGMTDDEFRALECERRKGIMVPSGFGTDLCTPKEDLELPAKDICEDPQAECWSDSLVPSDISGPEPFVNTRHPNYARTARPSHAVMKSSPVSYGSVKSIGDEDFDELVAKDSDLLHFVVFASKSCGPCERVLGVFVDEAEHYDGASFWRVEVAQNPDLAKRFEIRYTPTIIVFRRGQVVGQRRVGAASRDVLAEYVKRSFNVQDAIEAVSQS